MYLVRKGKEIVARADTLHRMIATLEGIEGDIEVRKKTGQLIISGDAHFVRDSLTRRFSRVKGRKWKVDKKRAMDIYG